MNNKIPIVQLLSTISEEGKKIDQFMRFDLEELRPNVDDLLYDVLDYGLFTGGKRIRPLLVVIASRLCGKNGDDVYRLGCAFEYLHAATLFHDDIIDNSDVRRGRPSVYKKFGSTAAILAGDFLLALAMERVGEIAGQAGLKIFCKAATGMADGEFMQLRNAEKHNLSELDYHNVIMGKTGLLIAAACEIGALYGGGDGPQRKQLKQYGVNLGCAFQIVDDLLDYLGDTEKTGKVVGNDLKEGKMTLPLILAIKDAGRSDTERLLYILRNEDVRIESWIEVCGLIKKYNGFDGARAVAENTVTMAINNLNDFREDISQRERALLENLATYVLTREK